MVSRLTTPSSSSVMRFLVEEKLVRTGNSAYPCIRTVAEQDEGVAMEKMGNGVFIIFEVVVKRVAQVGMVRFEFEKDQWNAVDKTYDIGTATVQFPRHFQLMHGQKMVVIVLLEIEHTQAALFQNTFGIGKTYRNALLQQLVFVFVDAWQRFVGAFLLQLFHGL